MDLDGERALITGASRGIGEATARAFAAKGVDVALAARSTAEIQAPASQLGGKAYPVDLADGAGLGHFLAAVEADGPIDILINNAGIETTRLLTDISEETLDQVIAVNLAAPIKLTRRVLPAMIERDSGHIVQVSSLAAVAPMPGGVIYNATKAGLTHATSGLALELKGTNIGLTTVHLGPVSTSMIDRVYAAELTKPYWKRLKRTALITEVSAEKVARDIVRAVQNNKQFVLHPKRALLLQALHNLPKRVVAASKAGIKFR